MILTSSPFDNQSGDGGLNGRHRHWCNKSNSTHCTHGHSAQNCAWLSWSTFQNNLQKQDFVLDLNTKKEFRKTSAHMESAYLRQSLLASCSSKFGHCGDDFTGSSSGHHLSGEDCDGRFHACTARHTCHEKSIQVWNTITYNNSNNNILNKDRPLVIQDYCYHLSWYHYRHNSCRISIRWY